MRDWQSVLAESFARYCLRIRHGWVKIVQGIGRQEEGADDVLHALQNGWRCLVFMGDVKDRDG